MANTKHLILLCQGAKAWNEWRSKNPEIKPDLNGTNLRGASLSRTDLRGANLSKTNLSRTQALDTNFEEATFTGACIEDWNINSQTNLNNIICDYVFLKKNQQERRPSDPNKNFEPGEFTKLFQKALETVDLIFSEGIDWQAFLFSFEKLHVECGSDELAIQAIEKKSCGAFVIRVEIPSEANKAEIEKYIKQEYELAEKVLHDRYQQQLQLKNVEIDGYKRENTNLRGIVNLLGGRPINAIAMAESQSNPNTFTNNLQGAMIGNLANQLNDNARQQANQYNYAPEQKQNLAEAAKEIQQLLEQLSETYSTNTSREKNIVVGEAVDRIESNPKLKAKVLNALKAFGIETFKEAIDHPLVNILVATIEGWQEAE
jgi:uncharacterized protein YjbI with pentapeptide repeats